MTTAITLFHAPEISPHTARAHAMKNCLSAIAAVSDLLDREILGTNRERMQRLRVAISRLSDLLTVDLREQPDERTEGEAISRTSVSALVTAATDALSDRAERAGVELFIQCGGGELMGHADALRELLINLLANAVDASAPGGAVFLATYVMQDGDQYWVVQDTGRGMSPQEMALAADLSRTSDPDGAGLGMAVARAVVVAHRGLVRIESAPSSGTMVSVWLPGKRSKG